MRFRSLPAQLHKTIAYGTFPCSGRRTIARKKDMRTKLVAALYAGTSLLAIAAHGGRASAADVAGPMTSELAAELSHNVNRPDRKSVV